MLARGELRVVDQVLEGLHGACRDACRLESLHQRVGLEACRPLPDPLLERILVRLAAGERVELRVGRPVGLAHGGAQTPPLCVAAAGDGDPAVVTRTGKGAMGAGVVAAVAVACDDLAVGEPAQHHVRRAVDRRLHL